MKQHALIGRTVLAGSALFLSAGTGLAGEPMPYIAPPPAPADCSGCINPGFYVEGSLLYLNSYASSSDFEGGYDGEWDFGFRGTLGWENADGLFVELTGFYYESEWDFDDDDNFRYDFDGDIEFHAIDLVVGDTIHCGEACLSVAAGLRYGGLELEQDRNFNELKGGLNFSRNTFEFDGWGPVIKIEGTRAITEQFGLYAEIVQAILFGEADFKSENVEVSSSRDTDTLASITEIGLGVEYKFGIGPVQNAFVRLGLEGQYWLVDSNDFGLFGGVLKIGGRF